MTQLTLSEHGIMPKGNILVNKKEIITSPLPEDVVTETTYHSKKLEEGYAESGVNEETYYEVCSPRLTESCEREIPIFVEDRNTVIPSQLPQDAEESEVSLCIL